MPTNSSAALPRRRALRINHPPRAPTADPTTGTEEQLDDGSEAAVVRFEADGGGSARDGEHHHGRGDTVVEPALDRDQLADPTRNGGVGHHRQAECGIRRRQCGTDEQGEPDADVREEPGRQTPPEQDRQGKADAEESTVGTEVTTYLRQAQPGGIREEHPHERDLDEGRQLLHGFHAVDQPAPREEAADAHEHDRWREAGTAGPGGEQSPPEEHRADDHEGLHVHAPPPVDTEPTRWAGSGLGPSVCGRLVTTTVDPRRSLDASPVTGERVGWDRSRAPWVWRSVGIRAGLGCSSPLQGPTTADTRSRQPGGARCSGVARSALGSRTGVP
jgi:hypothetical protein